MGCKENSNGKEEEIAENVDAALQGEFDDLDEAYFQCQPEITVLLERYLDSHFAEFIELA